MKVTHAPSPQWTHARISVAFDGETGSGEVGTVTLFTITGRVIVKHLTAFCTETLVGAATLECGVASSTPGLIAQVADATTIAANDWWVDASVAEVGLAAQVATQKDMNLSENVILTIDSANITDGTLIFDVWYMPVTDNGLLV